MKFVLRFPLFLIVLIIYNVVFLLHRDSSPSSEAPPEPAAVEVAPPGEIATDATTEVPDTSAMVEVTAPSSSNPLDKPLIKDLPLPKTTLDISLNDLLLILAILILYIELFKATKTGSATIVEHVFSLFVFLAFLLQFLLYAPAGSATFLTVTLLSFLDVVAGFTITISTARRDFGMGAHGAELH